MIARKSWIMREVRSWLADLAVDPRGQFHVVELGGLAEWHQPGTKRAGAVPSSCLA